MTYEIEKLNKYQQNYKQEKNMLIVMYGRPCIFLNSQGHNSQYHFNWSHYQSFFTNTLLTLSKSTSSEVFV